MHITHVYLYVCAVDYHNGTTLLSKEDLISGMEQPYDMTADGVVIWGSSAHLNDPTFLTVRTHLELLHIRSIYTCSQYNMVRYNIISNVAVSAYGESF